MYWVGYHSSKRLLSDVKRNEIINEINQMCLFLNVKKIFQEKGLNYQVFKNAKYTKFSKCSDDYLIIVLCTLSSVCNRFSNHHLNDYKNL